ncbi:MAG: hypothetical protein AAF492_17040, partial [Verrucomicrobiota bacterium]
PNHAEIAGKIAERFEPLHKLYEERHDLEQMLVDMFDAVSDKENLKRLSAGIADGEELTPRERAVALARHLLNDCETHEAAQLPKLKSLAHRFLNYMNDDRKAQKAVNILFPFCWVNKDASARLPVIASRAVASDPVKAVAWSGKWNLSERMYLHHAYCNRTIHAIPATNTWVGEDEALAHFQSCLGDALCYDEEASCDEINGRLQVYAGRGEFVFLVLPLESMDDTILQRVFDTWEKLTLFFHKSGLTQPELDRFHLADTQMLEPELDNQLESSVRLEWGDVMNQVFKESREAIKKGDAFVL